MPRIHKKIRLLIKHKHPIVKQPKYPEIPLPVYKPTRDIWLHKYPRDEYLKNPAIKYPIYNRLPEFWRNEFEKKMPLVHQHIRVGTKRPQHDGLWYVDEDGQPQRALNVPVNVIYPPESNEGIWGGEGIIVGEKYVPRKERFNVKYKRRWKPELIKETLYSEILDKSYTIDVTDLTLDLIDEAYGFDFFILQTSTTRLQEFGSKIKRDIHLTLAQKDTHLYPNNPEMREKIYEKYKKHVLPLEQAEWVGLTLKEAMVKQWNLEKEQGLHDPVPLLKIYTEELLEKLRISKEIPSGESVAEPVQVFQMGEKGKPE